MNLKLRSSKVLVLVFCFCLLSLTRALAYEQSSYHKNTAKISPKVKRNRLIRPAFKNRVVYKQLQQTVDLSSLSFHTTFSEAIDVLRNSSVPPLRIVVLWKDLNENADIHKDTTIQIDGVSGIRLFMGLDILVRAVSSDYAKIGYIVKEGIIIIATKDSLPVKMSTRVYDISYLLAAPARFGFRPGFGTGWPVAQYNRQRGNMASTGRNDRASYRTARRRRSTPNRGLGQRNGRAGRISGIIRDTVRPDRWR